MLTNREAALGAVLGLSACLAFTACGDDDSPTPADGDSGVQQADAASPPVGSIGNDSGAPPAAQGDGGTPAGNDAGPSGSDAGQTSVDPVYAVTLSMPDPDGTNLSYVSFQRDLNFGAIKRETLKQFSGGSGFAAIGGHWFVGDSTTPVVTKYRVTEALGVEEVTRVNFGAYPLQDGQGATFYYSNFKDEKTVYMHYGEDKAFRIHWDPSEPKIVGSHTDTNLPEANELTRVGTSGNRTQTRWFKGMVMQPFHQTVLATDDYGPESYIAVYDPATHEEKTVHTIANCPSLEQATQDEQGNVYFSTTYGVATGALYGNKPAPCVVRAKPDGTLDPAFPQTDLREYTGGKYAVNFRYLRDGKATAHVLYDERLKNPNATVDYIWEAFGDSAAWEYVLIDLNAKTSKVFTGFKAEHDIGAYGLVVNVDQRSFYVFQIGDGTSAVYELFLDGTVKFDSNVVGDIQSIERIR